MAASMKHVMGYAPTVLRILRSTSSRLTCKVLQNDKKHLNSDLLRRFCSAKPLLKSETVTIHFLKPNGDKQTVQAKVGDNLLDVIVDNEVDIDGYGACEGTLACSTCHLIFKPEHFAQLNEKPTDEELDMLDLAYGLTDNSRLGCQVYVTKNMEGWEVRVPEGVADAREV